MITCEKQINAISNSSVYVSCLSSYFFKKYPDEFASKYTFLQTVSFNEDRVKTKGRKSIVKRNKAHLLSLVNIYDRGFAKTGRKFAISE